MLKPLCFTPFTTDEIKPAGWLKKQLEIQAEGLSGNLDKIWPDIKDSRWIGGDREGWERVPYWLDGFIPLAYLLDNEDMKRRAKKYIDAIISRQQEDGWICPCTFEERAHYDMWALFLICKVLVVYYDCTKDERIEDTVYRALKNLQIHMEHHTLFEWAAARWFECLIPIFWLYERRQEEWLLDLAYSLRIEGFNYEELFDNWRYTKGENKWTQTTHVVNLAMALKSAALYSRVGKNDPNKMAKQAYELLQKYHGMACGHFTGDECLSGKSPVQGSECCSVVEAMYSYENLLSVTGDPYWGDLAEALAFNALPATISPDMWTHQYDQQTNQVCCTKLPDGHVVFRTNSGESHLFGLEPNFGCCTANFNQGWPKFALSAFMKSENGIVSAIPVPSSVSTEINNIPVTCELETEYPFRNTLKYVVHTDCPVSFAFSVRIPGTAVSAAVNGEPVTPGNFFTIEKEWNGTEEIAVSLEWKTRMEKRPNDMFCVKRGPLLYSVAIKEEWTKLEYERDGVERKYPYCDYEIRPLSKWNYAFADDKFTVCENNDYPSAFSTEQPPVSMTGTFVEIDWGFENGVCRETPDSRTPISAPCKVTLIPYGCTNLRMTEMPFVNVQNRN